jgi:hypothetical protein
VLVPGALGVVAMLFAAIETPRTRDTQFRVFTKLRSNVQIFVHVDELDVRPVVLQHPDHIYEGYIHISTLANDGIRTRHLPSAMLPLVTTVEYVMESAHTGVWQDVTVREALDPGEVNPRASALGAMPHYRPPISYETYRSALTRELHSREMLRPDANADPIIHHLYHAGTPWTVTHTHYHGAWWLIARASWLFGGTALALSVAYSRLRVARRSRRLCQDCGYPLAIRDDGRAFCSECGEVDQPPA